MVLDSATQQKALANLFPEPPYQHDSDEDEDVYFYELDGLTYEFEYSTNPRCLTRINILK